MLGLKIFTWLGRYGFIDPMDYHQDKGQKGFVGLSYGLSSGKDALFAMPKSARVIAIRKEEHVGSSTFHYLVAVPMPYAVC